MSTATRFRCRAALLREQALTCANDREARAFDTNAQTLEQLAANLDAALRRSRALGLRLPRGSR